jgi:hypothetical protein
VDAHRLKFSEVKKTRLELLERQGGRCAICGLKCAAEQAVLDHSHRQDQGYVRAVLHRGCNALLGKCENNGPRYGLGLDQLIAFLGGAGGYLDLHREDQTGLVHPSHRTAEEKAERRRLRARRARARARAERLAEKGQT